MRGRLGAALLLAVVCACNALNGSSELVVCAPDECVSAPAPPSTPPPASNDAGRDSGDPFGGGCTTAACAAPPGFDAVLVGAQEQECPAGSNTLDVLSDPVAGPGACGCSQCATATPPSCNGIVKSSGDATSGAACNTVGADLDGSGTCVQLAGTIAAHAKLDAPAPSGGTCTASGVANAKAWTATHTRVCAAPSCDACAAPPPGFQTCVAASGDRACPANFPTKHLVGVDVALACGACKTCTITGGTCGGAMLFYGEATCMNLVSTIPAGLCVATMPTQFKSYKWTGVVASITCNGTGPPDAQASLVDASTVCCR